MTVGDHKKIDRRLYLPRYTFSEADHLANVTPGTTRRWLGGYAYRAATGQHVARPPVTPRTAVDGAASFIDLVEVVAIGRLKERGLSLTQIRKLVANCQEVLGVDRPLVHLQFKTGGREVFADQRGALVELGRTKGQ